MIKFTKTQAMKTDSKSIELLTAMFLKNWNIELNTYEDQFHRTDCWFNWNDRTVDVEVKKRRFVSNKYPTTIIDKSKYVELLKAKGVLVVMFDDCWYLFKDLKGAFIKCSTIRCPSTTDFGGYLKWKEEIELDLTKGTRYDY